MPISNISISNSYQSYHAHLYFDETSTSLARELREKSESIFGLKVGRFHEKLVGPHPRWSCQVTFGPEEFDTYLTWLEENRQGLSIFVHAVTGDNIKDHTELVHWVGPKVDLNLDFFDKK